MRRGGMLITAPIESKVREHVATYPKGIPVKTSRFAVLVA